MFGISHHPGYHVLVRQEVLPRNWQRGMDPCVRLRARSAFRWRPGATTPVRAPMRHHPRTRPQWHGTPRAPPGMAGARDRAATPAGRPGYRPPARGRSAAATGCRSRRRRRASPDRCARSALKRLHALWMRIGEHRVHDLFRVSDGGLRGGFRSVRTPGPAPHGPEGGAVGEDDLAGHLEAVAEVEAAVSSAASTQRVPNSSASCPVGWPPGGAHTAPAECSRGPTSPAPGYLPSSPARRRSTKRWHWRRAWITTDSSGTGSSTGPCIASPSASNGRCSTWASGESACYGPKAISGRGARCWPSWRPPPTKSAGCLRPPSWARTLRGWRHDSATSSPCLTRTSVPCGSAVCWSTPISPHWRLPLGATSTRPAGHSASGPERACYLRVLAHLGRSNEVVAVLDGRRADLTQLGRRGGYGPETRRCHARMLLDRNSAGDRARARSLLGQAIPVYRRIGMIRHEVQARTMLTSFC